MATALYGLEMVSRRKMPAAGVALAPFLGGFGAHRFYMRQIGQGIVYLALCWIPPLVAQVEAFLMPGRVRRHNLEAARRAALRAEVLAP